MGGNLWGPGKNIPHGSRRLDRLRIDGISALLQNIMQLKPGALLDQRLNIYMRVSKADEDAVADSGHGSSHGYFSKAAAQQVLQAQQLKMCLDEEDEVMIVRQELQARQLKMCPDEADEAMIMMMMMMMMMAMMVVLMVIMITTTTTMARIPYFKCGLG